MAQPWTCPNCDTQIDDVFQQCWRCGTMRSGEPDVSFTPAVQRTQDRTLCTGCGYPLKRLTGTDCPECGQPFDRDHYDTPLPERGDRKLDRHQTLWLRTWLGSWAIAFVVIVLVNTAAFGFIEWDHRAITIFTCFVVGAVVVPPMVCLVLLFKRPKA